MNDKNQNIKQKMSINQYGKRPCKVWLFQRKVEPFFLYQNLQLITLMLYFSSLSKYGGSPILVLLFVRVVDPAVLGRIDLADVSHHFHRLLELAQRASRALAIQQRWRQL